MMLGRCREWMPLLQHWRLARERRQAKQMLGPAGGFHGWAERRVTNWWRLAMSNLFAGESLDYCIINVLVSTSKNMQVIICTSSDMQTLPCPPLARWPHETNILACLCQCVFLRILLFCWHLDLRSSIIFMSQYFLLSKKWGIAWDSRKLSLLHLFLGWVHLNLSGHVCFIPDLHGSSWFLRSKVILCWKNPCQSTIIILLVASRSVS